MSGVRFYWGLFWAYVAQYAKSRLEYRGDFVAGLLSNLIYQSVAIVLLVVIFQQVPALAGWRQEEVFFIYGYFLLPYALFDTVAGGVWDFTEQYIIRGEMDRILTRPAHPLFQLLLEGIDLEPLIGLALGGAIMLWSGGALGMEWNWYDPLLLAVLVAGSTLIYLGVYLSLACVGFWYDGRTGLLPLMWNLNNYGRYPVSIYNKLLRALFMWVVPFAFVGFFPAAWFLRREAFLFWAVLTPVIGAAFFTLAVWIWQAGLRRYHGTGS